MVFPVTQDLSNVAGFPREVVRLEQNAGLPRPRVPASARGPNPEPVARWSRHLVPWLLAALA